MPVFVGVRLVCNNAEECGSSFPYEYADGGKPWLEMIEEARIQAEHSGWRVIGSPNRGVLLDIYCPKCKPECGWGAMSFEERVMDQFNGVFSRLDAMAKILGNLTND